MQAKNSSGLTAATALFGVASAWVFVSSSRVGRLRPNEKGSRTIRDERSFLSTRATQQWRGMLGQRVACEAAVVHRKNLMSAVDEPTLDGPGSHFTLMRVPERAWIPSHAIYGALMGPTLIESYQIFRNNALDAPKGNTVRENVVVASVLSGSHVNGHPGVVHGGILALLIDDVLGAGYEALGDVPMAYTANLSIDYRKFVPAHTHLYIRCHLVERVRRKLVWKVVVECPETGTIFCEASSVYVIPKAVYDNL
jgi:acyl-coenzyme A thioesterase PaaI-like protein